MTKRKGMESPVVEEPPPIPVVVEPPKDWDAVRGDRLAEIIQQLSLPISFHGPVQRVDIELAVQTEILARLLHYAHR